MSYNLLLSESNYPSAFENIEIESVDIPKQNFVENAIINSIKKKNKKFNIESIEYCHISKRYPNFQETNYSGAIVETFAITEKQREIYNSAENYIFEKNGIWFAQHLWAYVFLSVPKEQSRNSLVSQSIFPPLIDFMNIYKYAPTFSIANHPIYFLNIINKNITAASIIRKFAGLIAMDISYIEVFSDTISNQQVPMDPKSFLLKYNDYINSEDYFDTSCYFIDFNNKIFRIKTDDLVVGKYLIKRENDNMDFHGSDEKFYWMDLLPMLLLSVKAGYKVDYGLLELFITENKDKFSKNNKKIERFEILLNYVVKLMRGAENV